MDRSCRSFPVRRTSFHGLYSRVHMPGMSGSVDRIENGDLLRRQRACVSNKKPPTRIALANSGVSLVSMKFLVADAISKHWKTGRETEKTIRVANSDLPNASNPPRRGTSSTVYGPTQRSGHLALMIPNAHSPLDWAVTLIILPMEYSFYGTGDALEAVSQILYQTAPSPLPSVLGNVL
ncbi:hypothetical protein NA57DRAFT_52432 [Rhizodiscina lignyota]|uniref:Uncharacterized protein n=1 Tax=Rhizodiscina lignyota TaxID=1504668 RepID=A0A9P4IQX7_9PEZI|nr:hypothetical protein NA57DRAFT_52432 [Rhizodiscina lignyota]